MDRKGEREREKEIGINEKKSEKKSSEKGRTDNHAIHKITISDRSISVLIYSR